MRNKVLACLTVVLTLCLTFTVAEIVLRFLPVNDGFRTVPVDEVNPILHFLPNREVTWSQGWNFAMVNRVRVNNVGYVDDQDYELDPRPLVAVVGDSYVEAVMVPYREKLQGRLAFALAPDVRVYSLAASGAPLSQYLVWARTARDEWHASALVIVVVGNDFDESLAVYKTSPGFHHYVAGPDGSLTLRRFDYQPGLLRGLVQSSALLRYLALNVHAQEILSRLGASIANRGQLAHVGTFVGNTSANASGDRIRQSEAAVQAFLRDLVEAGWRPDQVLFVVDGLRYPSNDPDVLSSYFTKIRTFFMQEARQSGFEVIDMDDHFIPRFQATNERYDFPTDGHWNGMAHGVAAAVVQKSELFTRRRFAAPPSHGAR